MAAVAAAVPPWTLVFAAAVVVALAPRRLGFAVAVAATALVVPWSLALPSGALVSTSLYSFDVVPFAVDDVTRLLGVAFGFIAAVDLVYAAGSGASRRQAAFVLAYVGASLGAVFAGDWLTLVVWWELMAVTATLLVWDAADDATRAGFRYAVYHEVGGVFLVAGVLLQFLRTGTFVFGDGVAAGLPALLAAVGIGLNVGFLGLHVWLVDTYPRPHVATSVVLAGFTTKVGVYALVRAFPRGSLPVAAVGGAMLLFGVTMAILQTDLRRLLTYHIVSQVGYMVAGVAVASPLAAAGGLAHLLNNVLYKSLLFMVAGVLVLRTGEERLQRLGGLRREMPLTFLAFAVAALSIAGTPGFNGFVSKGMIFDGVEAAGQPVLWWVLLLGGVGTVVSFAKVGYYAFLHGPADRSVRDATPLQAAAMFAIAGVCVLFGVDPDLLFALLPAAGVAAADSFSPSQFLKAGGVLVAGLVAFALVRRPLADVAAVPDLDALYHPLGARTLRGLVRVVAATADALDDGAVLVVRTVAGVAADPGTARRRVLDGMPGTDWWADRTPVVIGTSVLLLALVLLAALAFLLVW